MSQYRISDLARSDLENIWLFIAEDNIEAANRFILLLVSKFSKLASSPEIGRQRNELALGLRSIPVGNHVIFYRAGENGPEIIRVLHGARDFPPIFQ